MWKWMLRLCAAIASALIFANVMPGLDWFTYTLSGCDPAFEDCSSSFDLYGSSPTLLYWMWFLLWLVAWGIAETIAHRRGYASRVLRHLRYAPLAILACFIVAAFSYDQAMIQYSRWEIRRYIHGDLPPEIPPDFDLHNDYRGWCGNGYSAHMYALYGDVAVSEYDAADPLVRARALQASVAVYDWLNGSTEGAFYELLSRAEHDPDPHVQRILAEVRQQLGDEFE